MKLFKMTTGKGLCLFIGVIFSFLFLPYVGQLMQRSEVREHRLAEMAAKILVKNEALEVLNKTGPEFVAFRVEKELNLLYELRSAYQENRSQTALKLELSLAESHLVGMRTTNPESHLIEKQEVKVAELAYFVDHPQMEYVDLKHGEKLPLLNYLAAIFTKIPGGFFFCSCGFFMICYLHRSPFKGSWYHWEYYQLANRKGSLLSRQFMMGLTLCLTGVLATFMVISGILLAKEGLGQWDYPLFYHNFQGEISQMPLFTYLLRCGLAIFLAILLLALVVKLCQQYEKSFRFQMITVLGLTLAAVFPDFLKGIPAEIAQLLPMSYLDLPKLILAENPWNSFLFTWEKGIFLFSFSLLLMGIITWLKERRLAGKGWETEELIALQQSHWEKEQI